MPEKRKLELDVVVTSVTSPAKIAEVAKVQDLNPQEVFVRINFKVNGNDKEFKASNKLRFLTATGYKRLLESRTNGTPINVTVSMDDTHEDAFIYVNPEENVSIEDLFSTPVEKTDNRASIAELMNL